MRGKPYLSVIIPAYNASRSLSRLLHSLGSSKFHDFEIIIGDDASHEQLTVRALEPKNAKQAFPLQVIRLTQNQGPAAARNAAAKKSRGTVLVFLDADVTVYADTLSKIADKFKEDQDLTAITGVWDKHQHTSDFFPQFKAMRDWSYWTNERDRDGYYYLFSTRVAAIRRAVFTRLGGFNEVFRQMEDVELTYRIAKRYAIIFAPDVRVHHEFEGFWPVARKYFWRSFYWMKLYRVRRRFDPVATTKSESATAAMGVAAVCTLGLGIPIVNAPIIAIGTAFLLVHLVLLRKFLWFCYQEKGPVFALKSVAVGLVLYCIIFLGAAYYRVRSG